MINYELIFKGVDENMSAVELSKRDFINIIPSKNLKVKWYNKIPYHTAITMISEGAAYIRTPNTIEKIYNKKSLKKFVLDRDKNICGYCGKYGDTIDHIIPKSKGGLSTPKNCMCACKDCNRDKADKYIEEWQKKCI